MSNRVLAELMMASNNHPSSTAPKAHGNVLRNKFKARRSRLGYGFFPWRGRSDGKPGEGGGESSTPVKLHVDAVSEESVEMDDLDEILRRADILDDIWHKMGPRSPRSMGGVEDPNRYQSMVSSCFGIA